jgi:hypothetical protein
VATTPKFVPRSGQLSLIGGTRGDASDQIMLVEPGSPLASEARRGRLYVVVERADQPAQSSAIGQLVIRTLRKAFYSDVSSSVTAALRTALRAANKALYEYNVGQPAQQRALIGITCAVLKDHDLYVAQVAPAQCYIVGQGRLRALPTPTAWGPARIGGASTLPVKPLGMSLFVEPELYRASLSLGDRLLICASNLTPLLDQPTVEAALREADPQAMLAAVADAAEAAGLADSHALAISCAPQLSLAAQQAPLSPGGIGERVRLATAAAGGWLAGLGDEASSALRGRQGPSKAAARSKAEPSMSSLPADPGLSPNPPARPRPIDIGEEIGERYEREQAARPARRPEQPDTTEALPLSSYLGEGVHLPPPRAQRRIDLGDGPALAASARPYRARYEQRPLEELSFSERVARPFQRVGLLFDDATRRRRMRRREPPRQPSVRPSGLSYRKQRPKTSWLLLSVLSLIVTLLILYGTTLSRQNATDRAIDYFTIAEQRMAEVREATDDVVASERLEIARQAIDEVRASPNVTTTNTLLWLRYQDLQIEYERALAAVQRLTFFDDIALIATHPLPNGRFTSVSVPPATSAITDPLVIENLSYIYALDGDPESGRLFRIPRDGGTPIPYLTPGDTVQTTVVGALKAQTWRTDQVVAVDEGPGGFGYYFRNGESWSYTKLGDSEIWSGRERLDVETYDGNLYIWGAEPGEILKYNSGFYGDSPIFWIDATSLDSQDLSTVVDMAVDGSIYLLRPDGVVLVFSAGRLLAELKPDEITPPITAVTRLFVTGPPDEGLIFILDTFNKRLIELDKKTGRVIQQIQAHADSPIELDELADLWVDSSGSRPIIYMVNGGRLLRAALPAPPRPFRQEPTPSPPPSPAP